MLGLTNLENIKTNVDVVSSLSDKPDISPSALKNKFDEAAKELKNDINATIDDLNGKLEVLNALLSAEEVEQKIENKLVAVGAGDMAKSIYDADGDGIVDNSHMLNGMTLQDILLLQNPIGTIRMTVENINPGSYLGGTWISWGQGRVPVGMGTPEQNNRNTFGTLNEEELALNFTTVEGMSGRYWHTLTQNELPAIEGNISFAYNSEATNVSRVDGVFSPNITNKQYRDGGTKGSGANSVGSIKLAFGNNESHNNMPPYITCYMWKRTA